MLTYDTCDMYLAGYLMACGCPLAGYSKQGGNVSFQFEMKKKLEDLVENYYGLKAAVSPQSYGSALKNLKNIIYQYNHNYEKHTNQQQPRKVD